MFSGSKQKIFNDVTERFNPLNCSNTHIDWYKSNLV